MFDTLRLPITAFPKEVTVHEHRAPTAETTTLFHELRKEATQSVVFSGHAPFSAEVTWTVLDSPLQDSFEIHGRFTFNGKIHDFCIPVLRSDTRHRTDSEQVDWFLSHIRKELLSQITEALVEDLLRQNQQDISMMLRRPR